MKFCIILPAYNESLFLDKVLFSFIKQSKIPSKLIIVDDNSTDDTFLIANKYAQKNNWIDVIKTNSAPEHLPGEKVINAFYVGLQTISLNEYDFVGKFDADIILPENYFKNLLNAFHANQNIGIAGGNLYIRKNNSWVFENISNKKKVRGPIKLYKKECFNDIGGLKKSIGWDTVDELLAQYHGWEIYTDESLEVKHLKPTGNAYSKKAKYKQGEAFYKMRYGIVLTKIASLKLALKKRNALFYLNSIIGFLKAFFNRSPFLVNKEEGRFIRKHRWKNILKKIF
jgi:glycosyltransferase involved in cell wall biosynthesis